MNKEDILKILEGAEDKNGDVPMRLVRLAFKKLPEPCTDTISRHAAIEYFMTNTNWHDEDGDEIHDAEDKRALLKSYFDGIPSAQPEQKTGKWIKISPAGIYECSECGQNVMTSDIDCYKWCHGCGAKMMEEQDG